MVIGLPCKRPGERRCQESVDVFRKTEAKQKADEENDNGDYEPLAQLDEVIEQRRLGGFDCFLIRRAWGGHASGPFATMSLIVSAPLFSFVLTPDERSEAVIGSLASAGARSARSTSASGRS